MATKLRAVTEADLPALQQLSRTTFSDTFGAVNTAANLAVYLERAYSLPQLARELAEPTSMFTFIYQDEQLAGYLKLNWGATQSEAQGADSLEIQRIYVLPAFKRQGLGRQLFQLARQTAEQLGKTAIWLGVWEHNDSARAFYQQMGFVVVGEHVFQLGHSTQRDLILRKTLV